LGIGDWGLGIGDWAQSPITNPQSPIPNPHVKLIIIKNKNINLFLFNIKNIFYLNKKNNLNIYIKICPK